MAGLMTPRYVISDDDATEVIDRWEAEEGFAGLGHQPASRPSKASYAFNSVADARFFAFEKNNEFSVMRIVYRNELRNYDIEVRYITQPEIIYEARGTEHHPNEPGWFVKAIALDRGGPGQIDKAIRHFPLTDILAWDV